MILLHHLVETLLQRFKPLELWHAFEPPDHCNHLTDVSYVLVGQLPIENREIRNGIAVPKLTATPLTLDYILMISVKILAVYLVNVSGKCRTGRNFHHSS